MKDVCDWVTMLAAIGAAGFWAWSALIKIPDLMDTKLSGKGSITAIMQRQSSLSAIAAIFAAISAIAQIVSHHFSN